MTSGGSNVDALGHVAIKTPIELVPVSLVRTLSGVTPSKAPTAQRASEEEAGAWEMGRGRRARFSNETIVPKE